MNYSSLSLSYILSLLVVISAAVAQNLTRNARQAPFDPRYPYICGSDPLRYYSPVPCNMYRQCVNGGFYLNIGCTNNFQCQIHQADSICIDACCCTLPRFVGVQPTTQRFRDQGTSTVSIILPILISIVLLQ